MGEAAQGRYIGKSGQKRRCGDLKAENNTQSLLNLFHEAWRYGADLAAERSVGNRDNLAQKQVALLIKAAFSLWQTEPEDAGIFDQPGRGRDDNGRWISCLIDEVRLKYERGAQLARLGPDRRIEVHDIQVPALEYHSGT